MSEVADTWERGSPYEQYIGRWSRQVAPRFLSWLNIAAGQRWLDVGCGTGALSAAILDRCSPSSVVGLEPSAGFLKTTRETLRNRTPLCQADASAIPLRQASRDVVVSGLVLNFVPDQRAAVVEMARVAGREGTVAAYVWDYAGRMELIRFFWDAAVELDPGAATLDEGIRFPVCDPGALEALFASAGLRAIESKAIDVTAHFADFDDYWRPFLGGQGPAPAYALSLTDARRTRLRARLQERIQLTSTGGISLTARAWAIRGCVAAD